MNRVQLGWLEVPYIGSPVGSVWLGTWRMKDLGGSWTRMISMLFLLFSNMVFIRVLFFLTFCENIFRVSLIIVSYCLWLGELNWPWFPGLLVLFLSASLYWIGFSRRGIYSRQLYVCHKLHLVISPPFLRRFPRSQSQLKALKKTFR